MPLPFQHYTSDVEDNARWARFAIREGDIVISTRSKCGTTWMQMICALLIFQSTELPAPLARLSPWLDWLVLPERQLFADLAAQSHRRFMKTHVPLDGLPLDARASYIVVARNPLDAAVSLYHQGTNIDRQKVAELTGVGDPPPRTARRRLPLHDWLVEWIASDADPRDELDSLPGYLHHLNDAWSRRADPNLILVHYEDLEGDLESELRRIAADLRIDVPEELWPLFAHAAGFEQMRAHADLVAPDPVGVLKDTSAFFRRGRSGAAHEVLTDPELAQYERRATQLGTQDMLAWLHRGSHPT